MDFGANSNPDIATVKEEPLRLMGIKWWRWTSVAGIKRSTSVGMFIADGSTRESQWPMATCSGFTPTDSSTSS